MKRDLGQLKEELQASLMTYARTREERIAKSRVEEQAAASVAECIAEIMKLTQIDLPSVQGPYRVTENGEARYVSADKARQVMKSSSAHLLLDVSGRRLRYVRISRRGRKRSPAWVYVSWPICKVLRVALSAPGKAFGNLTITQVGRGTYVTCRSLSRYMADITRVIQGGGTNGPYVRHISAVREESESGRGYLFDPQWHYLVVEKCV